MKRMIRRAGLVLLAVLAAVSMSAAAFAAGTVTYDGSAKAFIFAPGSETSPTDLFSDLKSVMPGDKLTQQILVKNDAAKNVEVTVYLRALGAQAGSGEFLSQLKLTAAAGDTVLFDAPADQTAQLTDWVCLGTFRSGAEVPLDVTLEVPVTLDNRFQNAVGSLTWEFKVEEHPVSSGPYTGDAHVFAVFIPLLAVSACAMAALLAAKKRKTA